MFSVSDLYDLQLTSWVPIEGKSSVCLICMKYRIINYYILVIIIMSLGEILLSYNANTSRMHARTHARTHASSYTHAHAHRRLRSGSVRPFSLPFMAGRWAIQTGTRFRG